MNRTSLLLASIIPLTVLVSPKAEAGETGAVRGQVLDQDGLPIPNAVVILSGVDVAGERTVMTDANGEFRMLGLSPGPKDVLVRKEGFAPTKYTVTIRLDETAFVPVQLKLSGGAAEEIIVEETLPVIDATRTAVSQQMTADVLQNLPVGRSYQSAVNVVPGIYGRVDTQNGGPSSGNVSVRGEGQYGNNFLVDGISTRDPATKQYGSNMIFDAIREIQVYTDGYPAEFSNATGMLVNVVTSDGGDEHFGSAGYFMEMPACYNWSGEVTEVGEDDYEEYRKKFCYYDVLDPDLGEEVPTRKRSYMTNELSVTAGGPIVKEKLWYFAAARAYYGKTLFEAQDPEAPETSQSLYSQAKLTWFPSPDLKIQGQINLNMAEILNRETNGLYSVEAQGKQQSVTIFPILSTVYRPNERNELEFKASYWSVTLDAVPMSGDDQAPAVRDTNSGVYTGNYDSFDYNDRTRLGGSLKYTLLVDDVFGDHRFKTGLEYWRLSVTRGLDYTGKSVDAFFDEQAWSDPDSVADESGYLFYRNAEDGYPCTAEANYLDCEGYRQSANVDPISGTSNLFGFFLQDDWTVKPVTFNLGVRLDHEQLYQSDGTLIIDQWMPAPRFGAAWDVTRDSKTLVSVNAGRYYDVNGNDFVQWANTRSSNKYSEYRTNGDGTYSLDFQQDPAGNPLVFCTQESLDQLKGLDPEYYTDEYMDDVWTNFCNEEKLKPYHMDKVVVGIKREVVPLLAVGIKGIMSHTEDFPEDVDYDLNTWVVTNPKDEDGNALKVRDYRALELTVERKFDGVWQLLGSYTLSESEGHLPGQFDLAAGGQTGSDGNEVGVYLDDVNDQETRDAYFDAGYGYFLDGLAGLGREGDDSFYGYLPYHSYHQVKLSGSYKLPTNTTLGAVYEFDSGHAWEKRGYVWLYGDYFSFPEGRGTRFTPAVHYVNVRVAQEIAFNDRNDLELSLDVFNVLDLETPITYYSSESSNFGKVLYRQSPMAFRLGAVFRY